MARILVNTNTGMFGDLYIPQDNLLGVQLAQAIIHHVFYKQRFPEFDCPLFKPDLRAEIYELFVVHEELERFPVEQLEALIDLGVGYMLAFKEKLAELQKQYQREALHLPQHSPRSSHVRLVI